MLPATAAPSPGKFVEAYKDAFDKGATSVICLCVSGEVSGTYGAALAACDLLPDRNISVLGSRSLSMGQGFMVLAAGMANLLNIKPILPIKDGKLDMLERVRTRKKACTSIVDLVNESIAGQSIARMSIVHIDALEIAREFETLLRAGLQCPGDIIVADLTAWIFFQVTPRPPESPCAVPVWPILRRA